MGLKMVHTQEREIAGKSERLTHSQANKKRTNPARAVGCRNRVDIAPGARGLFHSHLNHGYNRSELLAGGHFWHNAAIAVMNFDLRGYYIGEQVAPISHQGSPGF